MMIGTRTVQRTTLLQEHTTYTVSVTETSVIVLPAHEHQFQRAPFLYAFYRTDEQGMSVLYDPAWHNHFANPSPYGYDDEGNIYFQLTEPFTGHLVVTCTLQTTIQEPQ